MNASEPRKRGTVLRIFISSTFRDLQAEREELVKRVFPQLREICAQRGVRLIDVDLRWGVTDADKAEDKILSVCFEEIERSHPMFVGILGERYGWIPDTIPPALLERHPWIGDYRDRSVTELEILHGLLNQAGSRIRPFFYFKDPASIEDLPATDRELFRETPTDADILRLGAEMAHRSAQERARRLRELKDRIRASGAPLFDGFRSARELGDRVFADLAAVIDELCPASDVEDPHVQEAEDQDSFAAGHTHVYAPDQAAIGWLSFIADNGRGGAVIVGPPGSGKSALIANWVGRERRTALPPPPKEASDGVSWLRRLFGRKVSASPVADRPRVALSIHVGASRTSADWTGVLRYLIDELGRRLAIDVPVPQDENRLPAVFADAVTLAAARCKLVVLIDGVDHLADRPGALVLAWLPRPIPEGALIVCTAAQGPVVDAAIRLDFSRFHLSPLSAAARRALATTYLAEYRKRLADAELDLIAGASHARDPLYLRLLLNELRLHGTHETLQPRLRELLAAIDAVALSELVLARWEQDYDPDRPGWVGQAMCLLLAARSGLGEDELLELLGSSSAPFPRTTWAALRQSAAEVLVERRGRCTFAHPAFRTAVERRYAKDERSTQEAAKTVAQFFRGRDFGLRRQDQAGRSWREDLVEYLDLLATTGQWEEIAQRLADSLLLSTAWLADPATVLRLWRAVEANSSIRAVDVYREMIERPASAPPEAALLLQALGHIAAAQHINAGLVDSYRQRAGDDTARTILIDPVLAPGRDATETVERMNRYTIANLLIQEAEALGTSERIREALAKIYEAEAIFRALGVERQVSRCALHAGALHEKQGQGTDALRRYAEVAAAGRKLRDASLVADAASNEARLHFQAGEPERALSVLHAAEGFARDAADARALAEIFNNLGIVLESLGRSGEALAARREAEAAWRVVDGADARSHLGDQLGSQGLLLIGLGRSEEALAPLREAAAIFRTTAQEEKESTTLGGIVKILGPKVNEGTVSWTEDRANLEEIRAAIERLLAFEFWRSDSDAWRALRRNLVATCIRYFLRLRDVAEPATVREWLDRGRQIAVEDGLEDQRIAIEGCLHALGPTEDPAPTPRLRCVHCGRSDDPSMLDSETQFVIRGHGKTLRVAQCRTCRERLTAAQVGYYGLLVMMADYPIEQKRAALVPGSDEF